MEDFVYKKILMNEDLGSRSFEKPLYFTEIQLFGGSSLQPPIYKLSCSLHSVGSSAYSEHAVLGRTGCMTYVKKWAAQWEEMQDDAVLVRSYLDKIISWLWHPRHCMPIANQTATD